MLIDSHCHLNFPQFEGQIPALVERMRKAGVDAALTVCTTMEEFASVKQIAVESERLWCSVGVHPDSENSLEPSVEDLLRETVHPKVIAVGETGLDFFRLKPETSDAVIRTQKIRFERHIEASLESGLPLIVHTRAAGLDTLALLRDVGRGQAQGVIHCFTENLDFAQAALDLGFYISFSGIVSFKNAADLREVAAMVPVDRLLVETDAPYLAPVPHRGKTNEPAWVKHVAECVATTRGVTLNTLAQQTTENFFRLFSKANPL